jgi:hypothetical protein
LAQVITLGFALLVGFRRSLQPSALLGALLLASLAALTLAMPWRLAVFWNALPSPLAALLWIPFTTSAAVGPLLFAFAAVFPVASCRREPSPSSCCPPCRWRPGTFKPGSAY